MTVKRNHRRFMMGWGSSKGSAKTLNTVSPSIAGVCSWITLGPFQTKHPMSENRGKKVKNCSVFLLILMVRVAMPIIYIFRNMALRMSAFGRTFSRSITWCKSVTRARQEVRSNNRNFPLSLDLKSMNGNQLIVPGGFFQNTSTVCSALIHVALVTNWRKL